MKPILSHDLELIEVEQNTPEWHAARYGIVTASAFKDVLAKGEGKTRAKYLRKKAAEIMGAKPADSFSNAHTERGHALEAEALDAYAFQFDIEPVRVGFYRRGPVGCSPDSIVGDDGLVQIKTTLPELLLEMAASGKVPSEHIAQLQGEMWVTGRKWNDLVVYWPGLPLYRRRVYRDEAYIATLQIAVEDFIREVHAYISESRSFTWSNT